VARAQLIITAVVVEGRSKTEVARDYGVSRYWVQQLVSRYQREGPAAFQPRSSAGRTQTNRGVVSVSPSKAPWRPQLGSLSNLRTAASIDAGEESARWQCRRQSSNAPRWPGSSSTGIIKPSRLSSVSARSTSAWVAVR
jgi:Homeodomain-like domain